MAKLQQLKELESELQKKVVSLVTQLHCLSCTLSVAQL